MTKLKIYNLEAADDLDVVCTLPEGEHILGRGEILNCNDKRVSRKHAVVRVSKDDVTIKAVHVNPCFFKSSVGNTITILPKDTPVALHNGDKFALLSDMFWFRIKIVPENDATATNGNNSAVAQDNEAERVTDTSDTTDIQEKGTNLDTSKAENVPSTSKRGSDEEGSLNTKRAKVSHNNETELNMDTTGQDVNTSPSVSGTSGITVQPRLSTEDNLASTIDSKRLISSLRNILQEDYGNNKENSTSVKIQNGKKDTDDKENQALLAVKIKVKQEKPDEKVKVKKEHVSDSEEENPEQNKEGSKTADSLKTDIVKKEEDKDAAATVKDGSSVNKEGSKTTDSLNTDIVKKEKDKDAAATVTDGPSGTSRDDTSCSTDTGDKKKSRRERCWYGPTCYRKNPIHRQDFSHPGDDDYDSDPDDDRPQCPFGGACYRRNLDHRRQFRHPNLPAAQPSKVVQVNVSSSCPHCPHCHNQFRKPDYESDYESDYEY